MRYYLDPISPNCPNAQIILKMKIQKLKMKIIFWAKQWGGHRGQANIFLVRGDPLSPPLGGPLTNKSGIPSFLINRNATVKLSSINTIHVKQQHVCFFIFKFTLKHMLGDVY